MQWYCAIDGVQHGPTDEAALAAWVREGRLRQDDLVWNPTCGNEWVRAGTALPALFAPPAQPWLGGAEPATGVPSAAAVFTSGTHNRDLMVRAQAALDGHWWLAAGVAFVFMAIMTAASAVPCLGSIVNLLIEGPLSLGLAAFALAIVRSKPLEMGLLFEGFEEFGSALAAYILMLIFVFLWTLLFIIPGIVAGLAYSMTYFILKDQPTLGTMEAIGLSRQMMRGNKWKYFCLQWRFLGWGLLCLLTCGIGFFWLVPYIAASNAAFYEDLNAGRRG